MQFSQGYKIKISRNQPRPLDQHPTTPRLAALQPTPRLAPCNRVSGETARLA
ncbi:MAG: hypothetical protein R3Y61_06720 [Rikenellaceae bacterium]